MIVGGSGRKSSFSMSVCMSAVSAGISEVLIKYTGKYVNIYIIMKITYIYHLKVNNIFYLFYIFFDLLTICILF